jgi:hypothetical protein
MLQSADTLSCRRHEPVCGEASLLASDAITRAEVEETRSRVAMGRGRMTPRDAFTDLLWQEFERARLGLPGGALAPASRRRAVLIHKQRLIDGREDALRSDADQLPPNAKLSECGRRLLREGK